MKLRRIEAVRFGGLADASLGAIGDGLTVVHGPNEAGKSTFTALVRHVLYGYPTQREKEPGYFVGGAGRLGRLVFEEDGGRWVIERTEGTHGGEVSVRTLEGRERPELLGEVTRGVSSLAFRIVFGFGLAEMADIEERRSSEDDIISKLYAASAGLAVSPHEVRAAILREAEELFRPTARKRELNTLVAELRQVRSEIRGLKADADSFQADQERRRELERRLSEARTQRDEARAVAIDLALAAEKAGERVRQVGAQEEALRELRLKRRQMDDERAAIAIDQATLDRAPELDALLDEASAFAAGGESLKAAEAAVARAEAKAAEAANRTGLAPAVLASLGSDHSLAASVDEARDDLQRLQAQAESRVEEAQRAGAAAAQTESNAAGTLEPLGISLDGADEVLAERLAALDALETVRGGGVVSRATAPVPAAIMLVSGLVAVIAGLILREWVSLAIGVVLSAAGAFFLLRPRSASAAAVPADERPYLTILGLEAGAGALELSRMRRALETARSAQSATAEARTRAEAAATDATLSADAVAARRSLWEMWLRERGLPGDAAPGAVAQLIVLAREARVASDAAAEARAEAGRVAERLDDFAARLGAACRGLMEAPDPVTRDDVPVVMNRARELLSAARTAAARVADLVKDIAALDSRIEDEAERSAQTARELRELLERFGVADGGSHEDLTSLAKRAEVAAKDAETVFDALAEEKNQLEGRLQNEAHERRGSDLRLTEAGLRERLADALDRYLVLTAAARLVSDALERYERERQPEVVKRAGELFEHITGGAYAGLSVPIAESRIEVFDSRAGAKTSDILSQGAAEQLYLALRLGLISQLGDVGSGLPVLMDDVFANFDPQRRRGAAEAVAELAASRQVVFFTCHPETAALFEAVAPGHARIDLARRQS